MFTKTTLILYLAKLSFCCDYVTIVCVFLPLHRPAIVVLLMSMVNDKQPFVLRCSVLYCFVSFLYKNDLGQSQVIQTLLPSSTEGMQSQPMILCLLIIRSTSKSRPNNIRGGKCPSVRPQKVSSISMKFGI